MPRGRGVRHPGDPPALPRAYSWTGNTGVLRRLHHRPQAHPRDAAVVFADSLHAHPRRQPRRRSRRTACSATSWSRSSVGRGAPIPAGGRIQTTPSLIEELDNVKERVDGVFGKVEETIGGIAELPRRWATRRPIRNVQGLLANVNEVSRQIAEGKGLVGALLNDDQYVQATSASTAPQRPRHRAEPQRLRRQGQEQHDQDRRQPAAAGRRRPQA